MLWEPDEQDQARANITRYGAWLANHKGLEFASYEALWRWSVSEIEAFWTTIWEYFKVRAHRPYTCVLKDHDVSRADWFRGAQLNYAEQALLRRDDHLALLSFSEGRPARGLTYAELSCQVATVAVALKRLGVRCGDRVVAYMPNIPETIVAFLAASSLGAIWSSCSPDFGARGVVDRFRQIEPRVLFAVDGYRYGGTAFDRTRVLSEIRRQLPSLDATVLVPHLSDQPKTESAHGMYRWRDLINGAQHRPSFEIVPFSHPLWIVYSSGTTGLPKAIVHSHGGVLLEMFKTLSLHLNLSADDRFFWFTTTGWIMWNVLTSGLLLGATVVLCDGSHAYPNMMALWQLAEEARITYLGVSAPYILACMKSGVVPRLAHDFAALRAVGSTGAPLPPEGFQWIYECVKDDVLVGSMSGGTDVSTAFVGSCPIQPVTAGEIQCRELGAKVEAFNAQGVPVVGELGELVVTEPLPSMPLYFWGDHDGRQYRESYFATYPGVWRHGDWIKITDRGTCVIHGRSDATLNRGGVRMGTSEFYRIVEEFAEVSDSIVVDTGHVGRDGDLLLFVVLQNGVALDDSLKKRIRSRLREELSPRHVPDEIYEIDEVPRTLNAKKLEVPVKRILAGLPAEGTVRPEAMSNPQSLQFFVDLARARANSHQRC